MEWLFPAAFTAAFLITKKDLALVCAMISAMSSYVFYACDPADWTYEQILVITMALNLGLAMVSGVHWKNNKKPLARCMVWISSLALLINLVQAVEFYAWTSDALLITQLFALVAIITLDGRKGFSNDLAANAITIVGFLGSLNSHHKGGGR